MSVERVRVHRLVAFEIIGGSRLRTLPLDGGGAFGLRQLYRLPEATPLITSPRNVTERDRADMGRFLHPSPRRDVATSSSSNRHRG